LKPLLKPSQTYQHALLQTLPGLTAAAVYEALEAQGRAGTAMQKLRIVIFGFGTARLKRVLEQWTNPKPLQAIWDRAAI
jgi:hypothetical protein